MESRMYFFRGSGEYEQKNPNSKQYMRVAYYVFFLTWAILDVQRCKPWTQTPSTMPGPLLPLAGVVWGNISRCENDMFDCRGVKIGTSEMTLQIKLIHGFENEHETIPRDPIDDWGVQSSPKRKVFRFHAPFSFGDWIPIDMKHLQNLTFWVAELFEYFLIQPSGVQNISQPQLTSLEKGFFLNQGINPLDSGQ